jgi:hypothetical protein
MGHIWLRYGALLLLVAVGGCASIVPPQTKVFAPIDPGIAPRVFVTTNEERETVVAALERAGFSITSDLRKTPLVLAVRLGGRRSTRGCGSIRNVVYDLRHAGVRIALIKGRGWAGSCTPNILLDMSAELARLFDL